MIDGSEDQRRYPIVLEEELSLSAADRGSTEPGEPNTRTEGLKIAHAG